MPTKDTHSRCPPPPPPLPLEKRLENKINATKAKLEAARAQCAVLQQELLLLENI